MTGPDYVLLFVYTAVENVIHILTFPFFIVPYFVHLFIISTFIFYYIVIFSDRR